MKIKRLTLANNSKSRFLANNARITHRFAWLPEAKVLFDFLGGFEPTEIKVVVSKASVSFVAIGIHSGCNARHYSKLNVPNDHRPSFYFKPDEFFEAVLLAHIQHKSSEATK